MRILLPLLALFAASTAQAHEFWLSPLSYHVPADAPIRADLRVGENFSGAAYSYLPNAFTRFDIVSGGQAKAVNGRMGDAPALTQAAPAGLAVLVHETTARRVIYDDWGKFQRFATHKGYPQVLQLHRARGLPDTGFSESYRRYAKALVAVGIGRGQDAVQGLEIEIIAGANPYTDALSAMPIQVLYQGAPHSGQLEVFEKDSAGTVTVFTLPLGPDGRARVPVKPGHEYLLDSVVLRATDNDDPKAGPVWHSLWASLTFRVP